MPARPLPFLLPREPDFRRFWLANQPKIFGRPLQAVAAHSLMSGQTDQPGMTALMQALTLQPILLVLLTTAALADSFDLPREMLPARWVIVILSFAVNTASYLPPVTALRRGHRRRAPERPHITQMIERQSVPSFKEFLSKESP